jgi:aldehyde dehydrogenase (NAD+)
MINLASMRAYYESGATRGYEFRKQQLIRLKEGILHLEKELHEALHSDLKKSPEESWVTDTGFVVAEINYALRNLKTWMKPERVSTNLLNFPSSSRVYKEPKGLVLIIGPWNYPIQLLIDPLVGAIAAGNCALLKPSEYAPATAGVLQKLIQSKFAPDYINLIQGDGAQVITPILESFRFDHIFYTGSTRVGRLVYEQASRKLVPVTLELGGKSPCVVAEDANVPVAARRIAVAKFSNAGQMCVAPDFVLAHESIKDQLIGEIKKSILQFYTSEPASSYNYGKIVNEMEFLRLKEMMTKGKVIAGGRMDAEQLYIEPTILEDPLHQTIDSGEEIFGPLLPIIGYRDEEEAIALATKNPEPLAFYLFTSSMEREKKWLDRVPFGSGCINNVSWHLTNYYLPFGGRGNSGIGSYHGRFSFDVFSHRKSIMKTPTWFDPGIRYPPFKGKLNLFKKFIR